jgi:hypothetical protein
MYTIIMEFDMAMKIVRQVRPHKQNLCCSSIHNCTHNKFLSQNYLKQGDGLLALHFKFALECANREVPRKSGSIKSKWDISAFGIC